MWTAGFQLDNPPGQRTRLGWFAWKLFDAAVDWAANVVVSTKPTLDLARQANGSVTITFTGRLESSDSLSTPNWQTVTGTGSINVQPTGQQKYYRAANP